MFKRQFVFLLEKLLVLILRRFLVKAFKLDQPDPPKVSREVTLLSIFRRRPPAA
jgi:hypothetical protein